MFIEKKKIIDDNLLFQFDGEKIRENLKLVPEKLLYFIENERIKKNIYKLSVILIEDAVRFNDYEHKAERFLIKLSNFREIYLLYFAEKLNIDRAIYFEETINRINHKSFTDLKDLYRRILTQNGLSRDYSDLNTIEMKRLSKNNIIYHKTEIENDLYLFEIILEFAESIEMNDK